MAAPTRNHQIVGATALMIAPALMTSVKPIRRRGIRNRVGLDAASSSINSRPTASAVWLDVARAAAVGAAGSASEFS